MQSGSAAGDACCGTGQGCVFAKALLARAERCELSARRSVGERELLDCRSPTARINCGTLAALLHERSRFALRLAAPGQPLLHVHALKLQCGGLAALRRTLAAAPEVDVHALVRQAQEAHGSLAALPWQEMVTGIVAWQPRRRR